MKGGTWGFGNWAVAFVVIAGVGCGGGDGDDPLAGRTADPDEVRKAMAALQAKGVEFMEVDRKGNPGGVRLGQSQVTDTDLMHLKPLIHLKTVDLGGLQITDAGLANLADLPLIEKLNLGKTMVTDAGLGRLAKLKRLKELNLSQTRVTNMGLVALKALTALENLHLTGCAGVTDEGLDHLVPLENLKSLLIEDTACTDAGEEKFSKQRRSVNVQR